MVTVELRGTPTRLHQALWRTRRRSTAAPWREAIVCQNSPKTLTIYRRRGRRMATLRVCHPKGAAVLDGFGRRPKWWRHPRVGLEAQGGLPMTRVCPHHPLLCLGPLVVAH